MWLREGADGTVQSTMDLRRRSSYNSGMQAGTTVGVDIGGSGVRAAVVEADGTLGVTVRCELKEVTAGAILTEVVRLVEPLKPARVGVGVPGFVRQGVVLGSPNLPDLADVALGEVLQQRLGVPVAVHNDANAATLGAWARLGRPGDLLLLTLGTGVGGGVISDGRLVTGARGTAAELGHIFVGGDQACGCGGVGCLETWCGTAGLVKRVHALGFDAHDAEDVLALAEREPAVEALLDEVRMALEHGLVTLLNTFAPEALAFAGGLSLARDVLEPAVHAALARCISASVAGLSVHWLGRADELAIAGAAGGWAPWEQRP